MRKHGFKGAAAILLAVLMLLSVLPVGSRKAHALTMNYTPSSYYRNSTYYTNLINVTLTGNQRADLVSVAVSQLGYHEGDNLSGLSGTSNGSSNYTEYGYWWGTQVNGSSSGSYYAWCAYFVSWCARQANIPTSIISNAPYACAGNDVGEDFLNLTWHARGTYTPQAGDLIFFCWDGDNSSWDHVEIVRSTSGSYVTSIGGNTGNDCVESRTWSLSSSYIRGYGVPNYGSSPSPTPTPSTNITDPNNYPTPPSGTYLNVGDSGNYVKWLQACLCQLGYTCDVDGQFGSGTETALSNFQRAYGLTVDGGFGPECRTKILALLTVATPSISLAAVTGGAKFTLSCSTSGATIYYTTNGNTPTTSSTQYTGAFTVTSTTTVKAIAVKSCRFNSSAASKTATIYTVTFKDWDGTTLKTQKVLTGHSATAPANPTRTGYTFTGWDKSFTNVTSNLTVTAQYTIITYTVTFKDWDGTVLKTQTVNHGASATAPANPTRPGYIFTGWNKDFSNVTSNLTVTAQYSINPLGEVTNLTVSINENGAAEISWSAVTNASKYSVTVYNSGDEAVTTVENITATSVTVELPAGKYYAKVTAIHINGADTKTSSASAVFTAPIVWTLITNRSVSLRNGPGNNYDAIKTVPAGKTLKVLEFAGTQLSRGRTTYNGTEGWVYYGYCDMVQDGTWVYQVSLTNTETIIMREEVSTSSTLLTYIPNGTVLVITEMNGNRAKTTYDGYTGWITITFCTRLTDPTNFELPPAGTTLSIGDSGEYVKWLQACLWQMGYYCELNGTYDAETESALNLFKARYSLTGGNGFNDECRAKILNLFTVLKPVISSTINENDSTVSITCETSHSEVHYTLDGTTPTKESPVFTEEITVPNGTVVKAIGVKECRYSSVVVSQGVSPDITVTYVGAYTGTAEVPYGGNAILPVLDVEGVHYTFTVGGEPWDGTNLTEDVTVTVGMEINSYTVIFYDPVADAELSEQVIEHGLAAVAPAAPQHYGYTFAGWDTDFSNVTSDMTVNAVYQPVNFTVIFMDGLDNVIEMQSVPYHTAATAPADPEREGYTFTGWDCDFSFIEHDLVVNAMWERIYCTVTYTGLYTGEDTVEYGGSVILPVYGSATLRYTFTVNGEPWDGTNITSDVTVTVGIEIITYTVTFVDMDGTVLKVQTGIRPGQDAEAPEPPEHEGYTFVDWDTDFTNVQSDLTVTAIYEQNEPAEPDLFGDVDGDGLVTMADVTLLSMYLNGENPQITAAGMANADANADGTVDIRDIAAIYAIIAAS